MSAAVSYQVVLTKADKLRSGALEGVVAAMPPMRRGAKQPAAHPEVFVTSARQAAWGIAGLAGRTRRPGGARRVRTVESRPKGNRL